MYCFFVLLLTLYSAMFCSTEIKAFLLIDWLIDWGGGYYWRSSVQLAPTAWFQPDWTLPDLPGWKQRYLPADKSSRLPQFRRNDLWGQILLLLTVVMPSPPILWAIGSTKNVKVAHTRLPSVGFRRWSRFLAVSLQVTWVINLAVGCHYSPPGLQLPLQPLRGLLPILLLGEQRHNGCEQVA